MHPKDWQHVSLFSFLLYHIIGLSAPLTQFSRLLRRLSLTLSLLARYPRHFRYLQWKYLDAQPPRGGCRKRLILFSLLTASPQHTLPIFHCGFHKGKAASVSQQRNIQNPIFRGCKHFLFVCMKSIQFKIYLEFVYLIYTKTIDFFIFLWYNTNVDRRNARRQPACCKFTKRWDIHESHH